MCMSGRRGKVPFRSTRGEVRRSSQVNFALLLFGRPPAPFHTHHGMARSAGKKGYYAIRTTVLEGQLGVFPRSPSPADRPTCVQYTRLDKQKRSEFGQEIELFRQRHEKRRHSIFPLCGKKGW